MEEPSSPIVLLRSGTRRPYVFVSMLVLLAAAVVLGSLAAFPPTGVPAAGHLPGSFGSVRSAATPANNSSLKAQAGGAPLRGAPPLAVSFTGSASGGTAPYTWSWVFGDGGTSTTQSPSHTYAVAGSYISTLTVADSAGHTASSSVGVTVTNSSTGGNLTVTASATPGATDVGAPVSFAASASGGTPPYLYAWHFGDGTTSAAANASHAYAAAGTYSAYVTIHDAASHWANSSTLAITVNPAIAVVLSASPASGPAPLFVSFMSNWSGGTSPYTFSWLFGDGGRFTSAFATHTFTSAGTYTVHLWVNDSLGDSGLAVTNVSVNGNATGQLQASLTVSPTSGPAPLTVSFMGTASGGSPPYSYRLSFGDGGSAVGPNATHVYSSAGTYTATFTVSDSAGHSASATSTITVSNGSSSLVASASARPTSGSAPLTVSFSGSASGGSSPYLWAWSFGDGGTSSVQSPTHTYWNPGTFTALLTVHDSSGLTASASVTVSVLNSSTNSSFALSVSATPSFGCAPLNVSFQATATGGSSPYNYAWTFGDGTTGRGNPVSHTYASSGAFTATVTASDSSGQTAWASTLISVNSTCGGGGGGGGGNNSTALEVGISADPAYGPAPLPVSFVASASGGQAPFTYAWSFGDGSTGTSARADHTYSAAGNYVATVTVTDAGGDQAYTGVFVTATGAGFTNQNQLRVSVTSLSLRGTAPFRTTFVADIVGGEAPYALTWDFGDGSSPVTGTSVAVTHTYYEAGSFALDLQVSDSSHQAVSWGALAMGLPPVQVEASVVHHSSSGPLNQELVVLVVALVGVVAVVVAVVAHRRGRGPWTLSSASAGSASAPGQAYPGYRLPLNGTNGTSAPSAGSGRTGTSTPQSPTTSSAPTTGNDPLGDMV